MFETKDLYYVRFRQTWDILPVKKVGSLREEEQHYPGTHTMGRAWLARCTQELLKGIFTFAGTMAYHSLGYAVR